MTGGEASNALRKVIKCSFEGRVMHPLLIPALTRRMKSESATLNMLDEGMVINIVVFAVEREPDIAV